MPPPPHGFPLAPPGAICMLAATLFMAAPAPALAQNFFEQLFGGGFQPQAAAYAPTSRGVSRTWPRREQRLRSGEWQGYGRSKSEVSRAFEESGKPEKVEPPPMGAGPLGPFLNDPTLRSGDVVVTSEGLMVYRGGGGSRHSPRDFASLAKAGSKNSQLAAIERANRRGKSPLVVVETAASPKPQVTPKPQVPPMPPPVATAKR